MAFDKHRFRFRKDGELRFVSHLDLMRAFERMLRRSQLPIRYTEGFHPQPRLVFAQSLSLGIAGLNEVVEIEYTEPVEPVDALTRLTAQALPGLTFLSCRRIELKQVARTALASFQLPISESWINEATTNAAAMLASTEVWVEREKPRQREVNIRPYLRDIRVAEGILTFDIWVSQDGTARADEIVRALGLQTVVNDGGVIARADLAIDDELSDERKQVRPKLPGRDDRFAFERPLTREIVPMQATLAAHTAHWGASPNGPVLE